MRYIVKTTLDFSESQIFVITILVNQKLSTETFSKNLWINNINIAINTKPLHEVIIFMKI